MSGDLPSQDAPYQDRDPTVWEPKGVADATAVKELFGLVLDAVEEGDEAQRERALSSAAPDVREAVVALLEAHKRATGVLLDESTSGASSFVDEAMAMPETRPPQIEGYEIGEEIGRGGFGIVYRAKQTAPVTRAAAVKLLRTDLATPETLARFHAESGVLARMNHQGVARVYDAGIDALGRPFVAMELIEGEPITKACDRLGLGLRQRVELMIGVCDAVQHAHQRAVIHRDLKPANVLVERGEDGPRARVIDFGIAKLLDEGGEGHATRVELRLGTPRYMSPEQRRGDDSVDTRVDVYALGAMLCELLCGQTPDPMAPGNRTTRPSTIAEAAPEPLTDHARQLRGDLDRIIIKATEGDRELRYTSAAALGEDLRRYLLGQPISATAPSVWYTGRKFIARHRLPVTLVAGFGLALVVTLTVAIAGWGEANRQRDEAMASSERTAFISDFLLKTLTLTADVDARQAPPALSDGSIQTIADMALDGLEHDPENMLRIINGIVAVQAQFGDDLSAERTSRRALDFAISHYGTPSPEVIEQRVHLHDLLWGHGIDGWKEQISAAKTEAGALLEPDDPRRMRVEQRAPESTAELERIVALYEAQPGIVPPLDHRTALFSLSMRYRFGAQSDRQIAINKRLYEMSVEHFGPQSAPAVDALAMYAESLAAHSPSEEALALTHEALERSSELLGHDHFTTEMCRRTLVMLYRLLGRPEEGVEHGEEDLRIVLRTHGEGSIQHAIALHELGATYVAAGRTREGIEHLTQALTLKHAQWPEGSNPITAVQMHLAGALRDAGRLDEADAMAVSALEHMKPGDMAKPIVRAVKVRASIMRARGQDDRADELIAQTRDRLTAAGVDPEVVGRLDHD